MGKNPVKVIIAGDIVPASMDQACFDLGNISQIVDERIMDFLKNVDARIYNLECVLTDSEEKEVKAGPYLKCNLNSITGIKQLQPTVLVGANNHSMDYGEKGINDTKTMLEKNNIIYLGVGTNRKEARNSASTVLDVGGTKVGIYCCAEDEFSASRAEDWAGANPYDPLNSFDDVKELADKSDYVIVIYHGGLEYYKYPSPNMQRIFRKFADNGAAVVIAQHGHCIGCEEKYQGKRLIYGQGNFIYNNCIYDRNGDYSDALMIEVDLLDNGSFDVKYWPIRCGEKSVLLDKDDAKQVMDDFQRRSLSITEKKCVEYNYLWEAVARFSGVEKDYLLYDNLRILNNMQCESLRELVSCAYGLSIGRYKQFLQIIPNAKLDYFFKSRRISIFGAGKAFEVLTTWLSYRDADIEDVYTSENCDKKVCVGDREYIVKQICKCEDIEQEILICTGFDYWREIYEKLIFLGYEKIYVIGNIWELETGYED